MVEQHWKTWGLSQQKLHEAQQEVQGSAPGAEQSQTSAQGRDQFAGEHIVRKLTSSYPFYIRYVPPPPIPFIYSMFLSCIGYVLQLPSGWLAIEKMEYSWSCKDDKQWSQGLANSTCYKKRGFLQCGWVSAGAGAQGGWGITIRGSVGNSAVHGNLLEWVPSSNFEFGHMLSRVWNRWSPEILSNPHFSIIMVWVGSKHSFPQLTSYLYLSVLFLLKTEVIWSRRSLWNMPVVVPWSDPYRRWNAG